MTQRHTRHNAASRSFTSDAAPLADNSAYARISQEIAKPRSQCSTADSGPFYP